MVGTWWQLASLGRWVCAWGRALFGGSHIAGKPRYYAASWTRRWRERRRGGPIGGTAGVARQVLQATRVSNVPIHGCFPAQMPPICSCSDCCLLGGESAPARRPLFPAIRSSPATEYQTHGRLRGSKRPPPRQFANKNIGKHRDCRFRIAPIPPMAWAAQPRTSGSFSSLAAFINSARAGFAAGPICASRKIAIL